MNFYEKIAPNLLASPKSELLTTTAGRVYTRGDIDRLIGQMANFMTALGVKPGDRVSVQVHKSVANLCLYLACLRAGFVFHPLNPAYQESELSYFIGNAKPALIVCDPQNLNVMRGLANAHNIAHVFTLDGAGDGTIAAEAAGQDATFETAPRKGDDLAFIPWDRNDRHLDVELQFCR